MKHLIIKTFTIVGLLSVAMMPIGCKKDFKDPNRATQEQVFSSPTGLAGVAVGLQRVYTLGRGSTLYNLISINGLTTNELFVVNTGNTDEVQLAAGGTTVDGNNVMLTTYWTTCNKVVYDADLVINNAKNLGDKNYGSGLIAYASIFKALSIGDMAQFWEKVPAGTGTNVTFIDRVDGFKKAVTVLDDAITAINTNPVSASFLANVPSGIDITNTLYALKARYSLYAGLYPQALAAANQVDLSKKSTFNFDATNPNPVFSVATSTNNVVQVKDSTLGLVPGLQPDFADKRISFYTSINPTIAPRFRIKGFFDGTMTSIPVYLPGEITLIKSECYARASTPDLLNAMIELNKVITKVPATDPFGVGAQLPPAIGVYTQGQVLDSIYKHRSIELFMSGLKLEDMRRFNRPNSERRRNLMPYPLRERDNNPNTPPDPPF
ncbi:MAG: RagB/SusD family nutrient uptake outer membrane protein [Bacteroidetes bacterium]|nr:RagB/SusD family nutrient uptake outer membrane protein [Bacteroidota bacterium]